MHKSEYRSIIYYLRYEAVTKDQCSFITEEECQTIEKEVCKDFPETVCEIVDVTKTQNKCEVVEKDEARVFCC